MCVHTANYVNNYMHVHAYRVSPLVGVNYWTDSTLFGQDYLLVTIPFHGIEKS